MVSADPVTSCGNDHAKLSRNMCPGWVVWLCVGPVTQCCQLGFHAEVAPCGMFRRARPEGLFLGGHSGNALNYHNTVTISKCTTCE